jgi:hypothetical protein
VEERGTVSVDLNQTSARLLASLCVALGTEDAAGVLSRALGLLDLCVRTKDQGGRVCFVNARGEQAEVVF